MKLKFKRGKYDVAVTALQVRMLHGGVIEMHLDWARKHLRQKTAFAIEGYLEEHKRNGRRVVMLDEAPEFGPKSTVADMNRVLDLRVCTAWLDSESPVHDQTEHGSAAVVVWVQRS